MRPSREGDTEPIPAQNNLPFSLYKMAKHLCCIAIFESSEFVGQHAVKRVCNHGHDDIKVYFRQDRRGQRVEVEKFNSFGDDVLAGKGLARCNIARFQPLPFRTTREVFPQAAHPMNFVVRIMRTIGLASAFTCKPLRFSGASVSNPRKAPTRRRDIRYSTFAILYCAFSAFSAGLTGCGLSSRYSRGLH